MLVLGPLCSPAGVEETVRPRGWRGETPFRRETGRPGLATIPAPPPPPGVPCRSPQPRRGSAPGAGRAPPLPCPAAWFAAARSRCLPRDLGGGAPAPGRGAAAGLRERGGQGRAEPGALLGGLVPTGSFMLFFFFFSFEAGPASLLRS